MEKIINAFFSVIKVILLLVSFILTFYIIMNMYHRLEKNIVESIPTLLPFIILLFLFVINFIFGQKGVTKSMFYNISCCLAFSVILFAVYRAFYDTNMVMILKLDYNINFNYFADVIAPMKAMLYLLSVANIFLMFSSKREQKKDIEVVIEDEEVII